MPPLTKRKRSNSRQGTRASHFRLETPSFSRCSQCRSAILPHRVCPVCGYYDGREVLKTSSEKGVKG